MLVGHVCAFILGGAGTVFFMIHGDSCCTHVDLALAIKDFRRLVRYRHGLRTSGNFAEPSSLAAFLMVFFVVALPLA